MTSVVQTQIEMERWPKIAKAWRRAFWKGFDVSKTMFPNKRIAWEWWLKRDEPKTKKKDNQIMFFED